jgi:hypothetical protein
VIFRVHFTRFHADFLRQITACSGHDDVADHWEGLLGSLVGLLMPPWLAFKPSDAVLFDS